MIGFSIMGKFARGTAKVSIVTDGLPALSIEKIFQPTSDVFNSELDFRYIV